MTDTIVPPEGQLSFSGIPSAEFIEDVDSHMAAEESAESQLKVTKSKFFGTAELRNIIKPFSNFTQNDQLLSTQKQLNLFFKQVLDEKHQKYKFMETNLINRRRRLKGQIPDIKSSLIMIEHLREKSGSKEEIESHFLISDQAYSKAVIPPTNKVL